jgi:PAS domain S-box-containing protein
MKSSSTNIVNRGNSKITLEIFESGLYSLLNRMMGFVLSSSGASRAVLLMKQGSEWLVRARGDTGSDTYEIVFNEPFGKSMAEKDSPSIPQAVFDHCRRTKKALITGDAKLDYRFAGDTTIQEREIRSLACIPVLSQGRLKAMLYLENDQMADIFTMDRVEILEHLSAQFDISMENALLYGDLSKKIAELKQIEERYELAAAGSTAGIWDWNIEAEQVFYSDHFQELLGYTPGEFSESLDEFWDRMHPDDYDRTRLAVRRHLEERIRYLADFRLRTGSGEYRWFHSRGQALWDDDGKAVRMSGSLADITERKRAEKELTMSEKRFRRMMEQSPLGIEILSPEGQIVRYNKAWLKLWGLDEEEAAQVVASYNMITDQQVRELGVLPLVKRAFTGENIILPPIHYRGEKLAEDIGVEIKNPHTPWIQCYLYSIRDEDGKIVNVVNTYMDITKLKLVEQEAREHRETLARIDRATSMGQLTGSISHELNQPLTGILSNAQAAELLIGREDLNYDELTDIISSIIADAKRAGDVIRNLHEVYREQKGEFLPVDINKIVAETVDLMHSEFIIQNVTLAFEYAPHVPAVSGNRIQIQQVLVNILMNGIQAMSGQEQPESRLHVKTAWDGSEVMALVEDNGPGIDADKIDHIFEPLATWKPGGTGMGLAISNAIIKAHGGRMIAKNRPEGGARVGFAIPVIKEEKKHG